MDTKPSGPISPNKFFLKLLLFMVFVAAKKVASTAEENSVASISGKSKRQRKRGADVLTVGTAYKKACDWEEGKPGESQYCFRILFWARVSSRRKITLENSTWGSLRTFDFSIIRETSVSSLENRGCELRVDDICELSSTKLFFRKCELSYSQTISFTINDF